MHYKKGSLVILKDDYKSEIEEKAGFYSTDFKERPLMISVEDKNIKGLLWAVPLTTKRHLSQKKIEKIEDMINSKSIVSNYYESVRIRGKEYYAKVRDVKPITEGFIDHIFMIKNVPLLVKNRKKLQIIEIKIGAVIMMSNRLPEKFEQNLSVSTKLVIEQIKREAELVNID